MAVSRARRIAAGVAAAGVLGGLGLAVNSAVTTTNSAHAYYLSPSGTATTGCTSAAPCGTLTEALRLAGAGDVIYLKSGTYDGSAGCWDTSSLDCTRTTAGAVKSADGAWRLKTPNGSYPAITYPYESVTDGPAATRLAAFSAGQYVTVRPAPGATVSYQRDIDLTMPHVQFDSITFRNAAITVKGGSDYFRATQIRMTGAHIVRFMTVSANFFELANSRITGNVNGSGVSLGPTGVPQGQLDTAWIHDNVIGDNTCTDCVNFHTDTVHLWGYRNGLIERNMLLPSTAIALYIEAIYADTQDLTVRNNVAIECTVTRDPNCGAVHKAMQMSRNGTTADFGVNVLFVNNTFWGEVLVNNTGIDVTPGLTLRGNIIKTMYNSGVNPCTGTFTRTSWAVYNLVVTTICSPMDASNVKNAGSPTFVNAAADDYRLASGSLGVDFGVASATTLDFAGKARDGQPDVGAYER